METRQWDDLRILLDKGANVAAKTNQGQTPLDLVLDNLDNRLEHEHLIKFLMLIDYGSDTEAKTKLREMAETVGIADVNTPDKVSSFSEWLMDRYCKRVPYKIDIDYFALHLKYYCRTRQLDNYQRNLRDRGHAEVISESGATLEA